MRTLFLAEARNKMKRKIKGTAKRPRLSVFRSNKAIYAQIIDDEIGKTLVTADERATKLPTKKATKTDKAREVGKILAKKALKKKIKTVVFDKGRYQYHGRVKALAEGVREGGLKF